MAFGWEGKRVRLVPLNREKHFDNCVRWVNDPELTGGTLIGDFPVSRLAEKEWFDKMEHGSDSDVVFAIETLDTEEHIGLTGLHQVDHRNGTGTTGICIFRKQLWNRGYATDAMRVRSRYAFHNLGLRMLLSEAMAHNIGSIRALEKTGYVEYGRLAGRYWKRGEYRDVIYFVLTRERWEQQLQESDS